MSVPNHEFDKIIPSFPLVSNNSYNLNGIKLYKSVLPNVNSILVLSCIFFLIWVINSCSSFAILLYSTNGRLEIIAPNFGIILFISLPSIGLLISISSPTLTAKTSL